MSDVTDGIDALRQAQLEKTQEAFGQLFDVVGRLESHAETRPDDTQLAWLVSLLRQTAKGTLNAVTCKVLANGAAVEDAR